MTDQPLWQPTEADLAASNLTRFIAAVRGGGVPIDGYADLYRWSTQDPDAFWGAVWDFAGVVADARGEPVLADRDRMPGARFFPEARLNFAENLLRRRDDGDAIVFRGEDRVRRRVSYRGLYDTVSRVAQALRAVGVGPGDRVAGYLPNLPEAIIAMLGASAIGAVWSSCSPDFGVRGVVDRFGQIEPKVLFSADGYFYDGKTFDVRGRLREIAAAMPSLERVVVVPYVEAEPALERGAVGWEDFIAPFPAAPIAFARLGFDHPLYILYSSGTTGAPKCIVHGAGGTLLEHRKEHLLHVDLKRADRFFYFTTCGWMMWNWLVSGLAEGATLLLYDGSPFYPDGNALFDLADETGMTIFGTSAKYIDAVKKAGLAPRESHALSTLRCMLSTGSPLAPEGFDFVYARIKPDLRLSSISGGTDIIGCFALGNPNTPVWRGELQSRSLGLAVEVFDDAGRSLPAGKGELVCTAPFPSMPVGFWNDDDGAKYRAAYFDKFPGVWCHGDWVELTEHDGMRFHGRSDTVLNPGGIRIGTAEIYRQVEQLDEVVESLVIGQEWEGDTRVVLFVRLAPGVELGPELSDRIRRQIREHTTPRHVPTRILEVADIPRTKSGKIVELAVRDVVHGHPVKNREALANPEALELYANLPELRA